jgi:ribosome-binding factor A
MPREFKRAERVAGTLRRELAQLIQTEVKDPEVGFVSLSDVEVTRDLAHAKVFVTVFEPDKAAGSLKALNKAAGYLRRRLGQEMRIRSVPELHFEHDASVETGQRMDSLIEAAIASDRLADDPDEDGDGGGQ